MLYYCPLESYESRYTFQLSAPQTGWLERRWREAAIEYKRVEGIAPPSRIKTGVVLDAIYRSTWAMSQVTLLLHYADQGLIKDSDIIFFDDFWHPGIEALGYTFHLLGINPKMYAFLYAQSVDKYDFTRGMLPWIRYYEQGNGSLLDGIFVASSDLKDLVCQGGIARPCRVHVTGLIFASDEVAIRMAPVRTENRQNHVIWSSRWDKEKDPEFFLRVVDQVLLRGRKDIKFIVCTSHPALRSNDRRLLASAYSAVHAYPDNFYIAAGLTKEKYYEYLCNAKVQFNCAKQDWVSFTLLEASVAGCIPVYPNFRSFPETLNHKENNYSFLYEVDNVDEAADRIIASIDLGDEHWWPDHFLIKEREWIHKRFDGTWKRMHAIWSGKEWTGPYA